MNDFVFKITGVFLIVILALLMFISVDFMELDSLRKANEKLKKENYDLKIQVNKLKEKELELIVKYVEE